MNREKSGAWCPSALRRWAMMQRVAAPGPLFIVGGQSWIDFRFSLAQLNKQVRTRDGELARLRVRFRMQAPAWLRLRKPKEMTVF